MKIDLLQILKRLHFSFVKPWQVCAFATKSSNHQHLFHCGSLTIIILHCNPPTPSIPCNGRRSFKSPNPPSKIIQGKEDYYQPCALPSPKYRHRFCLFILSCSAEIVLSCTLTQREFRFLILAPQTIYFNIPSDYKA